MTAARTIAGAIALLIATTALSASGAAAKIWPIANTKTATQPAAPVQTKPKVDRPAPTDGMPPERVEADVSAHNIEVTASFTGSEIVVFGTVDYSRQPTPESGYYDLVVIIEGPSIAAIARSKSNVGGLWVNTDSLIFDGIPSFYAISTTRPLEEIAEPDVLKKHRIGFDYVRMRPRQGRIPQFSPQDLKAYRDAIIRIKQKSRLYPRDDFGVGFIGRGLFRTSIRLPANVPVGDLEAQVYLFREGKLLSSYTAPVSLERQGVEAFIHDFAMNHEFWYGLFTVLFAAAAGLAAATLFRRN